MIEILAIHADGRRERLSLETEAQVEALQRGSTTLIRLFWSETLKRFISVPEDEEAS